MRLVRAGRSRSQQKRKRDRGGAEGSHRARTDPGMDPGCKYVTRSRLHLSSTNSNLLFTESASPRGLENFASAMPSTRPKLQRAEDRGIACVLGRDAVVPTILGPFLACRCPVGHIINKLLVAASNKRNGSHTTRLQNQQRSSKRRLTRITPESQRPQHECVRSLAVAATPTI